jgi:hypothetical protein
MTIIEKPTNTIFHSCSTAMLFAFSPMPSKPRSAVSPLVGNIFSVGYESTMKKKLSTAKKLPKKAPVFNGW